MKVLTSFSKPEEAHLLRAHLEGNGIAAFVRDEHTVSSDWGLSNAIGGVRVEVAEEDYEAACAFVAEYTPPQPALPPGQKQPRTFGRYLKVFAAIFAVVFGFLLWRSYPVSPEASVTLMLLSGILAGACAGFAALLDL